MEDLICIGSFDNYWVCFRVSGGVGRCKLSKCSIRQKSPRQRKRAQKCLHKVAYGQPAQLLPLVPILFPEAFALSLNIAQSANLTNLASISSQKPQKGMPPKPPQMNILVRSGLIADQELCDYNLNIEATIMAEGRLQSAEHDEDLSQLVSIEAKHSSSKQEEKRNKCIGEKLQIAVSVLLILYLLFLIVNFGFEKKVPLAGNLMAFQASLSGEDLRADDEKAKHLEISTSGVQKKQSEEKRSANGNQETNIARTSSISLTKQIQEAKLMLTEIKGQSIQNQQHSEDLKRKEVGMRKLSQALLYSSDETLTESTKKDAILQQNSKTQQIFEAISQNPHHSVTATTNEAREEIISRFFRNRQAGQSLLPEILKQNYLLQPQRTANDELYSSQLNLHVSSEEGPRFICAVVNTHNNAFNGQILRTLNSVFNQQYQQYEVIVADSFSNDSTRQIVKKYIKDAQISTKARLIEYSSESVVFGAYSASKQCKQGSLIVYLDGNCELIGKEVFQTINTYFAQKRPNILYADQYSLFANQAKMEHSRAVDYDQSQKFMPLYRNMPRKYGSMFVVRAGLLTNLPQNYINYNGKYFEYSGIDSLALSLLELSCGKIKTIPVPLVLSIRDSSIEQKERAQRVHQLKQIQMKSKLDYC